MSKEVNLLIQNSSRRLVIGTLSQLLVEHLDMMEEVDPVWRQKLRNRSNSFKKELDKEVNMLLKSNLAEKQILNMANVVEVEVDKINKEIMIQIESAMKLKAKQDEENKSKEVHEEVQANATSK